MLIIIIIDLLLSSRLRPSILLTLVNHPLEDILKCTLIVILLSAVLFQVIVLLNVDIERLYKKVIPKLLILELLMLVVMCYYNPRISSENIQYENGKYYVNLPKGAKEENYDFTRIYILDHLESNISGYAKSYNISKIYIDKSTHINEVQELKDIVECKLVELDYGEGSVEHKYVLKELYKYKYAEVSKETINKRLLELSKERGYTLDISTSELIQEIYLEESLQELKNELEVEVHNISGATEDSKKEEELARNIVILILLLMQNGVTLQEVLLEKRKGKKMANKRTERVRETKKKKRKEKREKK